MENIFQKLTSTNQKILVISLSIALVFLSLSIFILTVSKSFASSQPNPDKRPKIGLGVHGSYVYYFGEDEKLYRMPVNRAID
ncbi:hypothetical protein L0657_08490 [Dyadobacter sp. CY345]|uniref:hypothetical protein n=1 Tax=Dyadobacter sp. CY345 TaxID=2909335 RepID=UPI001F2D4102|nr:hypothetical protein [Dyadobacter sp. CY345]MCF2443990.1 hypothetical protein [Dyadobacter sp. CY345]